MTFNHNKHRAATSGQSHRVTAKSTRVPGQDGVWLPVIVVPSTFIFCVVMFFIFRVG
jgi:hypothetical protein